MIFSEYHRRFLKTLLDAGVEFIVIGGFASLFYGVRRNTGDLDILVRPGSSNGVKILDAFAKLDLKAGDLSAADFEKELFLGIGFEPDAVDLMNYTAAINFDDAFRNAVDFDDDGLQVKFINLSDLIRNKENLNRSGEKGLLDQYDLKVLKRINQNPKS